VAKEQIENDVKELFGLGDEERYGQEEATAKTMREFLLLGDSDKLNPVLAATMSDMQKAEIFVFNAIRMAASKTKLFSLKYFTDNYLLLLVSNKRKGREEIVRMITAKLAQDEAVKEDLAAAEARAAMQQQGAV
jgi:hypothetical protein